MPACSARRPAPSRGCGANIASRFKLQGPDGEQLRAAAAEVTAELEPPDDVQWIVDVDPVDML